MGEPKRLSHDESGMVFACPHCDKAGRSYERRAENTHADDPDKAYYCDACKRAFDEPIERTKNHGGPQPFGAELTPEDLGLSDP